MSLRRARSPAPAAAIAQHLPRPPHLEQQQQRPEAHDGAGHVGQVGAEIDRDRELPGDVAERADDGERPAVLDALAPADEIEQYPWREQRQDGDDVPDRGRHRQQRIAGDGGKRDDRRAERAIGDRGVVGDGRDPDGVEVGNAERDEDRRDEGPGIAEADQPFEQRAERPGEQHGLHAHVLGALGDQPAAEFVEGAGRSPAC